MTDTSNTQNPKRPSHTLYHVTGEGDDTIWKSIGAAWEHQDGKGFNLDLAMIPMKPGRLVVRAVKPKETKEGH